MKSISRFCGSWGRSSTKSCVFGKIFNFGGSVVIGPGIIVKELPSLAVFPDTVE